MKYILNAFLAFLTPVSGFSIHYSERFLEVCPLDLIVEQIRPELSPDELDLLMQHGEKILAAESNRTIGYSGHSQEGRIFQDILKAVFTELLEIEVPDDFHFLRTPGHPRFAYGYNPKKAFFHPEIYWPSEELQDALVKYFFLRAPSDLSKEDKQLLLSLVLSYEEESISSSRPFLIDAVEAPPSFDKNEILSALQSKLSEEPLLTPEYYAEKRAGLWSFMLDHPAHLGEELQLFFSLTFEGDLGVGSCRVLSMNPSLFNGGFSDESSLVNFVSGGSGFEFGERYQHEDLRAFFQELGLNPDDSEVVERAAQQVLEDLDVRGGVLIQVFDDSKDRSLMDKISYLSSTCGLGVVGADQIPTSALIDGRTPILLPETHVQVRLIIDNQIVLNPRSGLRIKRYDFDSPEGTEEKVMAAIKDALRTLPVDAERCAAYRQAFLLGFKAE